MILVAFLPSLLAGAVLADFVKTVLYGSLIVVAVSFVLGGIVILIVERTRPAPQIHDAGATPLARAVGIGLFQALALVPGVSRAGATIIGGGSTTGGGRTGGGGATGGGTIGGATGG